MWWYGMSDDGRECGGVVVRGYMSGGKGSSKMSGCRLSRDYGCLLSGGESVWGRVVLTFFLTRLVYRGLGVL